MAEDNARPAAAVGTPEKRSVGETLKEARNAQGLTLEQIATELRIELPQLEALEADRFERIGVPVFVKGYLRQYAARLGLDPRDLLARYAAQTSLKEVQVQPSKTIKLHDERQITVWVIAVLAILVVVVGLAAWWVGGGGGSPIASSPSATPQTGGDAKPASAPARQGDPASAPANGPAASGASSGSAAPPAEPAPSSSPSAPAATPLPSGAAAPGSPSGAPAPAAPSGAAAPTGAPTPSGGGAPAGAPTPSGGAAAATTTLAVATPAPNARASADRAAPTSPPPAAASSAPPGSSNAASSAAASPTAASSAAQSTSDDAPRPSLVVPLELTFEQESWAEVTDARGERVFYGLGTAGKHAQMRGEPPFAVVLGNAGGVKIVVDGEDFAVPAKGKPGEYARFSVNVVSD